MIHILLAEDDDVMRQYLARALERAGYEVTSVDRGTHALARVEAGALANVAAATTSQPAINRLFIRNSPRV